MRLILGIIIGFFLTLGTAYVADTGRHAACPVAQGRPLVNWDEVNLRFQEFSGTVQSGWDRLTGHHPS
ncbi:MAG TPA: hypothetical protein VIJ06_04025 [Methylovirgula sp.]